MIVRSVCLMLVIASCVVPAFIAAADDLAVVAVLPAARTNTASTHTSITVEFNQPVDPASVNAASFMAFGRWSGAVGAGGTYAFSNGNRTVTLTPPGPPGGRQFSSGEQVMVILSHDLRAADGHPLRAAGYSYQFWTAARRASKTFTLSQNFSVRNGPATQTYGGVGADLNGDGWLDISLTNEDTHDVRVFMNSGDGFGTYEDFLLPPQPVGNTPSPSEPADFNGDGIVDLCVANTRGESVSILIGAGDGTWSSHQEITVGITPRGIAAFDVDGDGDADVVNTNATTGNLSLLLNDGAGVFGSPVFFDGGVVGEWALAAADMNEDGILDLVTGGRTGQRIAVLLGNGDGTFTLTSTQSSGGRTWMLNCGDLNGDGHEDVACANSTTNNGAILFGDGAGNLAPPTTYATDRFAIATDIGDLDGDGDLDWVTSSFSGDWFIFENDGSGQFTFVDEILAPSAASCALLLDIDNDRDLDLGLIDEIADRLIIYKNDGTEDLAGLSTLSLVTGTILEGDIESVQTSNDLRLRIRSGFGATLDDLHHLEIVIGAQTSVSNPLTLDLTIESAIDQPSGLSQVRLMNRNTRTFDIVGTRPVGPVETVATISGIDAALYVGGGGEIDLSIKQIVFVPFLAFTFESVIDWVEIAVFE